MYGRPPRSVRNPNSPGRTPPRERATQVTIHKLLRLVRVQGQCPEMGPCRDRGEHSHLGRRPALPDWMEDLSARERAWHGVLAGDRVGDAVAVG